MAEQPKSPLRSQPPRSAAETMMRWELLKVLTGVRDQRIDPSDVVDRIISIQKSGDLNQLFLNGPLDVDRMKNVDKALHALAHEQDNSKASSPQAEGTLAKEHEQDSGLKELRLPSKVDAQTEGEVRRQPSMKSTKVRYRSSGDNQTLRHGVGPPNTPNTPSPQAHRSPSKSPSPNMIESLEGPRAHVNMEAQPKYKTGEGQTVQTSSLNGPPYPQQQPMPRAGQNRAPSQDSSLEPARGIKPHPRSSPQQIAQTPSQGSNPSLTAPEKISESHGGKSVNPTKPRDPGAPARTIPARPQPQQRRTPEGIPGHRDANPSGTVKKPLLPPEDQSAAQMPSRVQQMSPNPATKPAARVQNMNRRLPSQPQRTFQGDPMAGLASSNADLPRQTMKASTSPEAVSRRHANNRGPLHTVSPSPATAPSIATLPGLSSNLPTLDKFAEAKSIMDFDSSSEANRAATPASTNTSSPASEDTLLQEMAAETHVHDHGIELVEGDFTPEEMFELFMSGKLPKNWSSERNTGSAMKLMSLGALYASQAYLGKGGRKVAVEVANSLGVFS